MDKESILRTVLAVVLCTVVFVVWNMFFSPKPDPDAVNRAQENQSVEAPATPVAPPVAPTAPSEPPLVVQTATYEIGFDKNSGDIRYVNFDAYKLGEDKIAPRFMRADNKDANYAVFNAGLLSGYSSAIDSKSDGTSIITFTASNEQFEVVKQYTISENSYEIPMSITVNNLSGSAISVPVTVAIGPGLGEGFDEQRYVFAGPIIGNKKEYEKKDAAKVKDPILLSNPQWGGYTSKYFLFSLVSNSFERGEIVKTNSSAVTQFGTTLTIPASGTGSISDTSLFVGPKHYNSLRAYDIGMQKSIDYGMFFFLGIPMAKVMNFFYKFVHNYGVAIIILTFIVKLITLPLTLKSMKSMKAMSAMQPEMVKIREKYKDDPQRMNAATMELYKKHGANPMSGCLPMLIQLPIFVALYKALLVSIELKGAPFFGWIVDLSMKDPYYITPILMGVSMFVTQKMTPSAGDPTQQKIMLIMPVIFTFLFLNFPSGLVVYWLTNNLLSIVQQIVINRQKTATAK